MFRAQSHRQSEGCEFESRLAQELRIFLNENNILKNIIIKMVILMYVITENRVKGVLQHLPANHKRELHREQAESHTLE